MKDILKDIDWELKKRKLRDAVDNAKARAVTFYYNHEQACRGAAVLLGGFAISAGKNAIKDHRKNKERKEASRWQYDYREHTWYEAKRPLNNKEKEKLDAMYAAGMSKRDALKRLGLLK